MKPIKKNQKLREEHSNILITYAADKIKAFTRASYNLSKSMLATLKIKIVSCKYAAPYIHAHISFIESSNFMCCKLYFKYFTLLIVYLHLVFYFFHNSIILEYIKDHVYAKCFRILYYNLKYISLNKANRYETRT